MPGLGTDLIGGASQGSSLGPWGALAGGVLSAGIGLFQRGKANKWLKNNPYPTETIPEEVIQNQNAAKQMAATGLPSEQYANAMKNIQRNQLMALRGAHDRRGGLGIIGGIQQGSNDATLNLDAQDAQMRLANQRNLMNVNDKVAGWRNKVWQYNVADKYARDYDQNMSQKGAGNQNIVGGADKILAGLFGGNFSGGNGLFGGKKSNPYMSLNDFNQN